MSFVNTKITRDLNNNCVEVEVSSKRTAPIYYKVPKAEADSFCKSYKKYVESSDLKANLMFGGGILLCSAGAMWLTRNLSKIIKLTSGVVAGGLAGFGATKYVMHTATKKHDALMKKYNAETIDQNTRKVKEKKASVNDIIKR